MKDYCAEIREQLEVVRECGTVTAVDNAAVIILATASILFAIAAAWSIRETLR